MSLDNLIITDEPELWQPLGLDINVVSSMEYLTNVEAHSDSEKRIINLCSSYQYQTTGYYVSLLAEARRQKVFPSVMTIQDMKSTVLQAIIDEGVNDEIQRLFKSLKSSRFELSVYFGQNIAERYASISRRLYGLLPLPMFRVYFKRRKHWHIAKIKPLSIADIPHIHHPFLIEAANRYFSKKRYCTTRRKNTHYDLAILHNPNEKTAPSDKKALKKFVNAGLALGINVDFIEKDAYKFLLEYDALFIRETTSVNHHTYRFSRKAHAEGLVVMDDPISILRCTNKVYLAELLRNHRIKTPLTKIFSRQNWEEVCNTMGYPCVLKQPDGAFSQGVVQIDSVETLSKVIGEFFKTSDLIIAQEFMPSEFDWRIGIINHQPIYACRYYMAKDHWQIYNWQSADESVGNFDCVPLNEVPDAVLNTALRSTKLIGDGLYGVDLKQIDNKVYVIEINDNPNIDGGVEDQILGDKLYHIIMQDFLDKLKKKHDY